MKFSAPDWCFYEHASDPERYYANLLQAGYAGAEMVPPDRCAAARAAGLDILNLSGPGMQKGLNRREHHAELLPQIRDAIAQAQTLRIPHVIVFSGNRAGQLDSEGIANCRAGLEQVLPDAAARGVTLLFEMLNSRKDHPDYQADSGAYGFTLAAALASPRLKVLYDLYHLAWMGADVVAEVTANLPVIAHLHVAEMPDRNAPQARGNIAYAEIVPQIQRAGYTGYWGMEFKPAGDSITELAAARKLFQSFA